MSLPQRPVQTNINNDVLNTRSAMPNKSINSINENSFFDESCFVFQYDQYIESTNSK